MDPKVSRILLPALLMAGILFCPDASAVGKKKADPADKVGIEYLDTHFKTYDRIQKAIHSYAEVGYQEYKSSALLIAHLEENGFTVEKGVADIPTAFVATFGSGKPVIGVLAEYDALPGLSQDTVGFKKPIVEGGPGHGCGHNMLGTASVAGAVAISKWLAQGHEGTVKLFGCPAEEGGGGKNYMVRDGVFDGLDAVLNWHPSSLNRVALSPGLASMNVLFTFRGKSAHASGGPWLGRSALDGVEAFNMMVNLMREHITPETRIHYVITHGGDAPNVVPDFAQVNYYIRHSKVAEMLDIFERVKAAAEGAAKGTGTTVEMEILNGNYPVLVNRALCEDVLRNLVKVGGVMLDEREKDLVREVLRSSGQDPANIANFETVNPVLVEPKPGGGSSDVGSVSQVAPTSNLAVACAMNQNPGHCWQQVAIGGSTIGTKAVINVGKVFYLTAVDVYTKPELLKKIRDEYEAVQGKDFKYKSLVGDRKPPFDYQK